MNNKHIITLAVVAVAALAIGYFIGSGTTAVVSEKLNRRWVMCDESESSLDVIKKRLDGLEKLVEYELIQ